MDHGGPCGPRVAIPGGGVVRAAHEGVAGRGRGQYILARPPNHAV